MMASRVTPPAKDEGAEVDEDAAERRGFRDGMYLRLGAMRQLT